MCERSQFVRIGAHSSALRYNNGGIPQGTKLCPLLFAVIFNELLCKWGPRAKFVNVTADIQSSAETNNMELNPSKCTDMIVGRLHSNASVFKPIVIGATWVGTVSSFKFWCVYCQRLTWSVHCDHIIKKSNNQLYALRKLKRAEFASPDILLHGAH